MNLLSTRARKRAVAVGASVLAVITISSVVAADTGEGGGVQGGGTPGTPVTGGSQQPVESPGQIENITTGSTVYDPTILTKFISARGFTANQGVAGHGVDDDRVEFSGLACVSPNALSGGGLTILFSSVELPDGAKIKQLTFFGSDSAATDIEIMLLRNETNIPLLLGSPTRSDLTVADFTTSGAPGTTVVSSPDNLEEVTGSFTPSLIAGSNHRFHSIEVILQNTALTNHVLCGVEVAYQVPISTADPGTVFHPITPVRAYDSRLTAYPVNGPIANNTSRVVDISSGHDLATGAVTVANAVPAGATAITFNLTTAESTTSGFVAITPGDAATFATSSLNLNGTPLANGGTVAIAGDRTVKVFVGGGGSTQVIIDVTGYYTAPVAAPNMGN